MKLNLNPKLLDVVKTREGAASSGSGILTGTVVELLGSDTVLVEVADDHGASQDLISVPREQVEVVWRSAASETEEKSKSDAERPFEQGVLLLQNGLLADAKVHFARAFEIEPKLVGTLMNMVRDLPKEGGFETAVVVCQLIIELQPRYLLARENLAATYINRGVEYARLGAIDKALHHFNMALFLHPSEAVTRISVGNLVAAYTHLGIRHVEIKRYEEALSFFVLAFQLGPSDVTCRNLALSMVSVSAWRRESPHGSMDAIFKEPMLMGLTLSDCLNAHGATLASLGKVSEARDFISRAVDTDPENELAKRNLAILRSQAEEQFSPSMWGLEAIEPELARFDAA
jgi:tetratricopeptide (TPR) repeat protein